MYCIPIYTYMYVYKCMYIHICVLIYVHKYWRVAGIGEARGSFGGDGTHM